MGYSLCIVAIFGHFQNAFIFRILAVFGSLFLHRTTIMCLQTRFWHVLGKFYFLTQTEYFAWAIDFALFVIFGHFQNALIFQILAVFWSRFLHRTTLMCL